MRSAIHIVDREGRVLADDDHVLPYYSLTKPFIAATIFALGVDREATLDRWFDASWLPRAAEITIGQLLKHTSGIRDYGHLPEYGAAVEARGRAWSDDEFADHTLRQPLGFEPGERFSYSNSGYWLLSQVTQRESGLDLNGVLEAQVLRPLGLESVRVARGIFADDLPEYPAEWVWYGLLLGSARDAVTFMRSPFVAPLRAESVAVAGPVPHWRNPHYACGLMTEPDQCFGHNGGGPGYTASCFHFLETGTTGCVLLQSDREPAAMLKLRSLVEASA